MPQVIHTTSRGISFRRNESNYVLILKSPDVEQLKGLRENNFLVRFQVIQDDGSEKRIDDVHRLTNEQIKRYLGEPQKITEYFVYADVDAYKLYLKEKKSLNDRARHLLKNLPHDAIEDQRQRHRLESMDTDAIEHKRQRRRTEFMDNDAVEDQRQRHRVESMTEEAKEDQRQRHRVEFMTEEAKKVHRDRDRIRRRMPESDRVEFKDEEGVNLDPSSPSSRKISRALYESSQHGQEVRDLYESSQRAQDVRNLYESSQHGQEVRGVYSASRSFSSGAVLSLDQVEVPLPNDLRNACTDLTAAYMLFCERSGQFLNREVDYIHTVWGDANEKLDAVEMLKLDPEQIPILLQNNSHILKVVERIGKPLTDDEITDLIELARFHGYDQNARYLNCSCCGMGNYASGSEKFHRIGIPNSLQNDSLFALLVLSAEEIAEYQSHGEFCCIFNIFQHPFAENLFLHLIPKLCEVDFDSFSVFATFCDSCFKNLRLSKLPKFCAKTCDLMNFQAFPGIRKLTTLELLILSPIRLYGLKYLICENGTSSFNFTGHCIAVPQDGPEQLCKVNNKFWYFLSLSLFLSFF